MSNKNKTVAFGCLGYAILLLSFAAAWFTHVFYCFAHDAWGFLIAGALLFPIAIVHGYWIWFHAIF